MYKLDSHDNNMKLMLIVDVKFLWIKLHMKFMSKLDLHDELDVKSLCEILVNKNSHEIHVKAKFSWISCEFSLT